jgi:glycosyltransferase involved in cell wall biosynthesis
MPKVTVLMSAYNGQRYLKEAMESILCQTWSDFEFLIINDGSTDKSREIIMSFDDPRIRLVENPTNIGLTKSLNHGLELSRTELIARQDADDISYPERLEQQVQFFETHSEVVLLGTSAQAIDEQGEPKKIDLHVPRGLLAIRWYLMFQNAFIHSSVMFRRSVVWENMGGYDESFARAQDYELWSRIARGFKVENLSDILIDHRFEYGSTVSFLLLPTPAEEDIALKNLKAFLDYQDVPVQWAYFINHLRRRDRFDKSTDWGQVAEILDQIYTRYCELHPKARLDQNIRTHLAANLYWLAYFSAPHNRRVSFKAYMRAQKMVPKNRRHPSLSKYLILWMTGETVRRVYHRFTCPMGRTEKESDLVTAVQRNTKNLGSQ